MKNASSNNLGEVDLLGDPISTIKDPRGRPAFAKSKENQLVVVSLAAAGWTQEQIGIYMQCDPKTLRKHFSRELDHGSLFADGMALQVIMKKMLDGNLLAAKRVREMAGLQPLPSKGNLGRKVPVLGKKAQRVVDASEVPEGWADILEDGDPVN